MELPENVVPMPTEQRAKLKRLAEAATPGPWVQEVAFDGRIASAFGHGVGVNFERLFIGAAIRQHEQNIANAAYIAAASPDVALATLDYVEALEARLHTPGYTLGLSREDILNVADNACRCAKREPQIMRSLLHMVDDRDEQLMQAEREKEGLAARLFTLAQQHQEAVARAETLEADRQKAWEELHQEGQRASRLAGELVVSRRETVEAVARAEAAESLAEEWKQGYRMQKALIEPMQARIAEWEAAFSKQYHELSAEKQRNAAPIELLEAALPYIGDRPESPAEQYKAGGIRHIIQQYLDRQTEKPAAALPLVGEAAPEPTSSILDSSDDGWYPKEVFGSVAEYDASVADVCRRIESGEIQPRQPDEDDENKAGAAPLGGEAAAQKGGQNE